MHEGRRWAPFPSAVSGRPVPVISSVRPSGAFMGVQAMTELSTWAHLAIWVPVTILSSLVLLQPIKGATIGLQWALYMHGFGDDHETIESHPES